MPRFHFYPAHPSLASTTVLSVLRLPPLPPPPGWILSQTQSAAPLRAKSEDMIARECLVFYKIGYPSWEILRERERPNFCSNWIALERPLPFDSTVAFRDCFETFRKIPRNLLKISCLFRRRLDANTDAVDRTSINVIRINVNPAVRRRRPEISIHSHIKRLYSSDAECSARTRVAKTKRK